MAKRTIEEVWADWDVKQKTRRMNIKVQIPQGLYWVMSDLLDAEWTSLTKRSGARRGREIYDDFMTEAIVREVQRRRREGTKIDESSTHFGYYQSTS